MKNDSLNEHLTIKEPKKAKLKEKGSVFIAQVFPIKSEDEAKARMGELKKEFFDATHHCFAFRIGKGKDGIFKYSDAGEPRGTAGKPIFTAIQSRDLTDLLVVVIRYFGGVKLGTGGLSRAYHDSALKVLDECQIIKEIKKLEMNFNVPLNVYGNVSKILSKYDCTILKSEFESNHVKITLEIEQAKSANLKKNLTEAADGKIQFV
jgi:uncharacterized YigZ family protein